MRIARVVSGKPLHDGRVEILRDRQPGLVQRAEDTRGNHALEVGTRWEHHVVAECPASSRASSVLLESNTA